MKIKAVWFALFLCLVAIAVALSGCGKQCQYRLEPSGTVTVGTLEVKQCKEGEVVTKIVTKWLPGGEVITHHVLHCAKVISSCP